ncbi:MAG TPA: hypothetical protein VK557_15930, partial [Pyrinomonadaceae bacterium]|nr:hypothetical protein [Pyrinomonadaceae bacterium]
MRSKTLFSFLSIALYFLFAVSISQGQPPSTKSDPPVPRAKDGKKLLTAMDLMKIANVSGPRISPDGSRVAYTVSEVKMEKDKEWKTVTQVWVVAIKDQKSRQYTRGDKSSSAPEWSPDGSMLAFLSDREKDGERQVWMMMADGGEAWSVTSHKGGVSGFHFSPNGKRLVLTAVDQPSKDEEDRKKVRDDTMVIDHDIKMTHLWLFEIDKKEEKRLTEGNYTVSDPQWSPDGTRITYTTRPTPKADDGTLSEVWMITVATREKKKLVDTASSDNARWSPDGKWIAYVGSPDRGAGPSTTYLYLLSPDGGAPKQLTAKFDLGAGTPVWSSDGKSIYFFTITLEANEVFVADVTTGAVKQLSRRGGVTQITEISRDGKTVVGTFSGAGQPTELYKSSADYTNLTLLTNHNAWLK